MDTSINGGLALALAGMLVVFSVLTLISGLVALFGYLDKKFEAKPTAAEAPEQTPEIDNLTLVLISAAVGTLLQGRHRIRRIHRIESNQGAWQQSGRAILHASHVISRKGPK